MKDSQRKAMFAKNRKPSMTKIDALDTAYKSDVVKPDSLPFSDVFLKKLQSEGLLRPSDVNPKNYWITQKGMNVYTKSKPYKKMMHNMGVKGF